MKFIEMTGKTLLSILSPDELRPHDLQSAGVFDDTIVGQRAGTLKSAAPIAGM